MKKKEKKNRNKKRITKNSCFWCLVPFWVTWSAKRNGWWIIRFYCKFCANPRGGRDHTGLSRIFNFPRRQRGVSKGIFRVIQFVITGINIKLLGKFGYIANGSVCFFLLAVCDRFATKHRGMETLKWTCIVEEANWLFWFKANRKHSLRKPCAPH